VGACMLTIRHDKLNMLLGGLDTCTVTAGLLLCWVRFPKEESAEL
jgi:hypothetical protein